MLSCMSIKISKNNFRSSTGFIINAFNYLLINNIACRIGRDEGWDVISAHFFGAANADWIDFDVQQRVAFLAEEKCLKYFCGRVFLAFIAINLLRMHSN